jgi:hypothetical protein
MIVKIMLINRFSSQRPSMLHRVVVLAYKGLCTFEFGIAAEMFGLPRPELGQWC